MAAQASQRLDGSRVASVAERRGDGRKHGGISLALQHLKQGGDGLLVERLGPALPLGQYVRAEGSLPRVGADAELLGGVNGLAAASVLQDPDGSPSPIAVV